jgi:hypothetical protein
MIGAVIGAVGSIASASAQAASYKAQSQYAARQAVMEQQKGAYESARLNDQTTRQLATMRGQYLSSGIALQGSPGDVIADSAVEASLDEQAVKYGAKVRSDNLTFESQLAKMNAGNAMVGGVFGAMGSLVNGLSNMSQQNQQRTVTRNPYSF